MGFVLTKRRREIILRISAGSPTKLGVAFADRMGSDMATILAIGDMWNPGLRGVVLVGWKTFEPDLISNPDIVGVCHSHYSVIRDSQGWLCHYIPPAQVLSYR
jgi:hypothetical protein